MPNRREFLQSNAATAAFLIFPQSLIANDTEHSFQFVQVDSEETFPIIDPVRWCLQNFREPILERASLGLSKLTENDGERIVRLVVRRCLLNLIELSPSRVEVHYWGSQGLADLRRFFKARNLARKEVEVILRNRKNEVVTKRTGDTFLYGEPIALDFPAEQVMSKWGRRFDQEADDLQAVPGTQSGFGWDGIDDGCIPWIALKSAWRSEAYSCLNCDRPTILTNFGTRHVGMFNRAPHFVHTCLVCRRAFVDATARNVDEWISRNIHANAQPSFRIMFGNRVARDRKSLSENSDLIAGKVRRSFDPDHDSNPRDS